MAKRVGPINNLAPSKKVKLDVSVNRGRIGPTNSNIVEFWASDDDDDVLLATQKAEEKLRENDGMRNIDSEFAFSEFAAQAHGTTSTQQILADEMLRINLPTNLNMEDIFGTDETFVFLPDAKHGQKIDNDEVETVTSKKIDGNSNHAAATRRQLAQDSQLKFLMERIDVLKKENVKLQRDLVDSNIQAGAKDGEVGLLRNELRQARKLLQASKMDKLTKAETDEKDCNEKVAEIVKQVIAKNAKLNFTNVEFSEQKIRNATNNERNIFKENSLLKVTDADEIRNLLRMENLCIKRSFNNQCCIKEVFGYAKDAKGQKKQRNFFEVELEQLLLNYAQMQCEPNSVKTIIARIHMNVNRVFNEFWSYTQSLERPQNYMMHPYCHFNLNSDHSTSMRISLIQPKALYSLEQAIPLRRYIGTLALICQKESTISQTLLCKKNGKYWVTQIIIEAITNLGYSTEAFEHFGVLEAAAALLYSLIKHVSPAKPILGSQPGYLNDILKQLVFTRPSPWVFRELSACMLLCAHNSELIDKMCINSPSNCFVSDRVRSLYRFGPKSCLIQVYAGLLELCFSTDVPLQPGHFKLLLSICENHVRFVYQCFTATPEFILRMLSLQNFTDEEKDENEDMFTKVNSLQSDVTFSNNTTASIQVSALNSTNISKLSSIPVIQKSKETQCECYVKLCVSVVTIVFQMMYQWMIQEEKTDIPQVGEISQISVQLLTLIFREYFLTCLFRDSEETTKHYLYLLCIWWKSQAPVLNFKNKHLRFLKQLQELQFMLKPLNQEANLVNPQDDLADWSRTVSDADADIQKFVQQNALFNSETEFLYNKSNFFNGLKRIAYNFE